MDSVEPLLSMQAARRRWMGLAALGVATLTAHLLAFSGLDWAWPRQAAPSRPAEAVQVRVIDPPPVAPAPAPVPEPPVKVAAARPRPATPTLPAPPQAPVVPVVQMAVVAPEVEAGIDTIPHYRTQMPPAMTLRYVLQRGVLRGSGDFSWRPDGDRYELRLEGRVAGLSVLTQISSGGFDADGIAPLRFTDQRLRRGTKAANFQRDAGKITFSGSSTEFPLRDGVQDRLSWMAQLGAILAAEPRLRGVGAKVAMVVAGANGDASVWAFDCVAVESVATGAGAVSALKFVREPREPYDTQVQVWVDPLQHYLPVRATQKSGPNDEGFELRLQAIETSP